MITKRLKKFLMENREEVRKATPTITEARVFEFFKKTSRKSKGFICSAVDHFGWSYQEVSLYVKRLHELGYLNRIKTRNEKGRLVYAYWNALTDGGPRS